VPAGVHVLRMPNLSQHQDDVLAAARTGPQQPVQQVTKRDWPPSSTCTCNRMSGCSDVSSWHQCRARRGVLRVPAGVERWSRL
jgi:hypothetical protein